VPGRQSPFDVPVFGSPDLLDPVRRDGRASILAILAEPECARAVESI